MKLSRHITRRSPRELCWRQGGCKLCWKACSAGIGMHQMLFRPLLKYLQNSTDGSYITAPADSCKGPTQPPAQGNDPGSWSLLREVSTPTPTQCSMAFQSRCQDFIYTRGTEVHVWYVLNLLSEHECFLLWDLFTQSARDSALHSFCSMASDQSINDVFLMCLAPGITRSFRGC